MSSSSLVFSVRLPRGLADTVKEIASKKRKAVAEVIKDAVLAMIDGDMEKEREESAENRIVAKVAALANDNASTVSKNQVAIGKKLDTVTTASEGALEVTKKIASVMDKNNDLILARLNQALEAKSKPAQLTKTQQEWLEWGKEVSRLTGWKKAVVVALL